jgi:hypothetical protein
MLPKEIIDIPEGYTEDDYNLYITSVDYSTNDLVFDITLEMDWFIDKEDIFKQWKVRTTGHRKNHISFDRTAFIAITNDHPLLWEFTDLQCELYFSGQCKDPAMLFYHLYLTHKSLFKIYQPFNISFGDDTNTSTRFQYTNGLLAEGPKKLITKYADCLKQNGLDYSIIGERPATCWDGKQFVNENKNLKVFLLGDTYIIAEDFLFTAKE